MEACERKQENPFRARKIVMMPFAGRARLDMRDLID